VSALLPEILWSLQPEATETTRKSAPSSGGDGFPLGLFGPGTQSIVLLVLMFVVFYFLLIRPNKKGKKKRNLCSKGFEGETRYGHRAAFEARSSKFARPTWTFRSPIR